MGGDADLILSLGILDLYTVTLRGLKSECMEQEKMDEQIKTSSGTPKVNMSGSGIPKSMRYHELWGRVVVSAEAGEVLIEFRAYGDDTVISTWKRKIGGAENWKKNPGSIGIRRPGNVSLMRAKPLSTSPCSTTYAVCQIVTSERLCIVC